MDAGHDVAGWMDGRMNGLMDLRMTGHDVAGWMDGWNDIWI